MVGPAGLIRWDWISPRDATAEAELVRTGGCSPAELLEACIDAVERLNPTLNSVVIPLYDFAREQLASGAFGDGPFRGVPLLLKDLGAQLGGTPQYGGTRFLRDHHWISPHDSTLVERFRAVGFVMFGKTNAPELGLSPTTEPDTFGPTRNPWNPERIVGGSSGGSAAAVASRVVGLAHAGDGGGSIRNPAGAVGRGGAQAVTRARDARPRHRRGLERVHHRARHHPDGARHRRGAGLRGRVRARRPGARTAAGPPVRGRGRRGPRPAARRDVLGQRPRAGRAGRAAAAVETCGRLLEGLGHDVHDGYPGALDRADVGGLLSVSVMASVADELEGYSRGSARPSGPATSRTRPGSSTSRAGS